MTINRTLRPTYEQLQADAHEMERLLLRVQPRFCFECDSMVLARAFEKQQELTWKQLERIESVMTKVDRRPSPSANKELKQLIKASNLRQTDLMRIEIARKIQDFQAERYDILTAYASLLRDKSAEKLFSQSLAEERAAGAKLLKIYGSHATAPQKPNGDSLLFFLVGANTWSE